MASTSSEVDEVLRAWCTDNPQVIGYVVMNSDGERVDQQTTRVAHTDAPFSQGERQHVHRKKEWGQMGV